MYERSSQRPLSRAAFIRRLAGHFGIVVIVLLGSLGLGVAGFMGFEGLPVEDAFLHSASLLGGLGLVQTPGSLHGKLFAGIYALYAGLVFVAVVGVMLAPVVHRILHKFHWGGDLGEGDAGEDRQPDIE